MAAVTVMDRWALLSSDGVYRYMLGRRWVEEVAADVEPIAWLMLNPSTADANVDDPTIRRIVRFSRDAGYTSCRVVNLYALRATDPAELARHPDPVGPDNDAVLAELASDGDIPIVCAWGTRGGLRAAHVLNQIHRTVVDADAWELWCLGTTKDGHPRHPLYVSADATFEVFRS